MVHETITLEGHLIDSDIMRRVFDRVVEEGGAFEVQEFRVGRTNDEASFARIEIKAGDPQALDRILEAVRYLGATTEMGDCRFAPAEADGILPDDFYSTTNFDTFVRMDDRWREARDQKMDSALVLRDGVPHCVKQRQVRQGEAVALRGPGIRVRPLERSRDRDVAPARSRSARQPALGGPARAAVRAGSLSRRRCLHFAGAVLDAQGRADVELRRRSRAGERQSEPRQCDQGKRSEGTDRPA